MSSTRPASGAALFLFAAGNIVYALVALAIPATRHLDPPSDVFPAGEASSRNIGI
jgi:hypothetical protein